MEPSIEGYNNLVGKYGTDMWAKIKEYSPGIYYKADYQKYMELFHVLSDKVTPEIDLYIAKDHNDIMHCIDPLIEKRQFRLYNIDHHHDLGYYDLDDKRTLEDFAKEAYHLGNWARKYLIQPNCILYNWIGNKNSSKALYPAIKPYLDKYMMSTTINSVMYAQFDVVFICASPNWVPAEYSPLFDALVTFVEKIAKK